jgi:transposase
MLNPERMRSLGSGLQIISEIGTDMTRWDSEKHFASWLGLAGGRKQSGKRKGSVKAHRNRAGRMFCAAAWPLAKTVDKALGGFYRRLRGRVGGLAANVALARKLALLFYRLLRSGADYVEKGLKAYEAKDSTTPNRSVPAASFRHHQHRGAKPHFRKR